MRRTGIGRPDRPPPVPLKNGVFLLPSTTPRAQRLRSIQVTIGAVVCALIGAPFFLLHHMQGFSKDYNDAKHSRFFLLSTPMSPPNNLAPRIRDFSESSWSTLGCLSPACIAAEAATLSRAFPSPPRSMWCLSDHDMKEPMHPEEDHNNITGISSPNATPPWQGMLLVKVPKAASSTAAGVALRLAHRHHCSAIQWMHRTATSYQHRQFNRSFLWTTVRDPAERAVSTIYFHVVSRQNVTATDEFMLRHLQQLTHAHFGAVSEGQGGFQLRYTSLQDIPPHSAWSPEFPDKVLDPARVKENVWRTLQGYDFVLVADRMPESLVALALLLDVPVSDVLVTSSKVAGSRYHLVNLPKNILKCLPTVKSFVSPVVQSFLQSKQWYAMNYGDYLLHAAAQASLDETIQRLGQERFQPALQEFHRWRALEQTQCAPRVEFPCNSEGQPQLRVSRQSCYLPFYDFGCGYKCIDAMIQRENHHKNDSFNAR